MSVSGKRVCPLIRKVVNCCVKYNTDVCMCVPLDIESCVTMDSHFIHLHWPYIRVSGAYKNTALTCLLPPLSLLECFGQSWYFCS